MERSPARKEERRPQQERRHLRVGLPTWAAALFVSGAGAVTGLAVTILQARPFDLFLGSYASPAIPRAASDVGLASVVGVVLALLTWLVPARTVARHRAGKIALAFAPCYLLLVLVPEYFWLNGPHIYSRFLLSLCLGGVVLLGVLLSGVSHSSGDSCFHPALAACLILTALHALLFSTLSIRMFQAMNLGYTDSGVWAEALSNTLRGRFLHSNAFPSGNVLGDHMVPILVFIVPLFAVFPRHETIHVINAIALSAGAVPVFFLAWWRWRMPWPALLLSVAYLAFPSVSHLVFCYSYGFHPVILSLPLLLAAVYFLVRGKLIRFWVFLGLALLCNETVAIAVAAIPLFILLRLKRKLLAAGVFVIAVAWFFLAVMALIPVFRGGEAYWQVGSLYAHAGGSVSGVVKYAAGHPVEVARLIFSARKLNYLLQLLVPLGLLSLLSPAALFGGAPTALLLLLAERPDIHSVAFWNQATLIPFIFLSAVDSIGKLGGVPIRASERDFPSQSGGPRITALAAFALVTSLTSAYFFGYFPLSRGYNPELFTVSQRDGLVRELRRMIPRDASLSATDRIASHFIDQGDLFVFMGEPRDTNYVLLDLEENWRPLPPVLRWRDRLLQDDGYGLVYFRSNFLLFEKGAQDSPDYRRLSSPTEIPPGAQRIGLASPEGLVVEAASVEPLEEAVKGEYRLTLFWSASAKIAHDYAARITLIAPGARKALRPHHLLSGVHPTSLWVPGEIYADSLQVSVPFDLLGNPWSADIEIIPEENVPPTDWKND